MPNSSFDFNFPAQLTLVYLIVWVVILGWVLARKDIEPIAQLMWVIVIIFVPFFGVILYWVIGPERTAAPTLSVAARPPAPKAEPTDCIQCQTVIPADATLCPKCGWTYKS